MKNLQRTLSCVGLLSLATIAGATLTAARPVTAQPAYGSYVGVGPGFGLTDGGPGETTGVSAVVAVRYKFLELPISLRSQIFLFSGSTAVVPTVSYDIPLNWQTDVYLGAGASLTGGDSPSPVGNRSAFALQGGVDYAVPNSNFVIYGNAVYALNAFKNSDASAFALQGGMGIRF